MKAKSFGEKQEFGGMTVFQWLIAGVVSLFVGVVRSFPGVDCPIGVCN